MTLNTKVEVKGSHSLREVFDVAVLSILKAAGREDEIGSVEVASFTDENIICTKIGQGLPGIVRVKRHDSSIHASFDTGYGYKDGFGQGPAMLHVSTMLFMEQEVPITRWYNEFHDVWNDATQGVGPGVAEFLNNGDEMSVWFDEILNHISSGINPFKRSE